MKMIVVTGAAGFIGSHLVDRLVSEGHQVVGYDDLSLGKIENLGKSLNCDNFRFKKLDVTDSEALRADLVNYQFLELELWHLAANSDIQAGVLNSEVDLRKTFLTTYATLEACRHLPLTAIYFASSSAVFGDHEVSLREDTAPLLPISNYGAMKLASEAIISAFVEGRPTKQMIFRFPNVVGSRATHGILHDFFNRYTQSRIKLEVLGNGSQEKQYLHVSELIEAMLIAKEKALKKRELINIGLTESTTKVRTIAEMFRRLVDPRLELVFGLEPRGWVGDIPKFRMDASKLYKLGWHPRYKSDEAVELAIRELRMERGFE